MKSWQVTVLAGVTVLGGCAGEPSESTRRGGDESRKFSDDRFLCDADNLALWADLEEQGVDVRGMGLTCGNSEEANGIRVSDSFLPADGDEQSADAVPNTGGSANDDGGEDETPSTDDTADNGMADDPGDGDTPDDPPDDAPDEDPAVTFSANLAPLIQADCLNCHSGNFPPRLDGYANAAAAGQASLNSILTNEMPPGNGWSPTDKELFQAWADAGFPE